MRVWKCRIAALSVHGIEIARGLAISFAKFDDVCAIRLRTINHDLVLVLCTVPLFTHDRSLLKDGCRTIPSSVMSAYATSASKRGLNPCLSCFLIGLESGDVGRIRGASARRIARAVLLSHHVPTRPA
jgi:hypothetical protein